MKNRRYASDPLRKVFPPEKVGKRYRGGSDNYLYHSRPKEIGGGNLQYQGKKVRIQWPSKINFFSPKAVFKDTFGPLKIPELVHHRGIEKRIRLDLQQVDNANNKGHPEYQDGPFFMVQQLKHRQYYLFPNERATL